MAAKVSTFTVRARAERPRHHRRVGRSRRRRRRKTPALRFNPTAWAKLLYWQDKGVTVGGFAVASAGDPLLVQDIRLVPQKCTAVAATFDKLAALPQLPSRDEARDSKPFTPQILIYTHPGKRARPTRDEEETFVRMSGQCEWAVLCVVAADGRSDARLDFRVGPGGSLDIPVRVAFRQEFSATNPAIWDAEYADCVTISLPF